MRFGVAALTAGVLAGGFFTTGLFGASKPAPARWPCQITFRDAAGDVIKSDTATGSASWPRPYVDGVDGVTCGISHDTNAPGTYNWLNVVFDSQSPRYLNYIGQQFEGSSYTSFVDRNYFQVKQLGTVVWDANNPSAMDARPFRSYAPDRQFLKSSARFQGDSDFGNVPGGTSSVFVQPLDPCSWQVWLDPSAALLADEFSDTRVNPRVMQVSEGTSYSTTRGYFPMPFSAVVKVISGKAGCPLP